MDNNIYLDFFKKYNFKKNEMPKIFKKSKKELFFDSKKQELSNKIKRNIFKGFNIPKIIQNELFHQELSFDEKVDYIGVGIKMPTHLDILIN